jgi:hypothetical protein
MADGGNLRNVMGGVVVGTSADVSLQLAGAVSQTPLATFDSRPISDALGPAVPTTSENTSRTWAGALSQTAQGGFEGGYVDSAFGLALPVAPASNTPALSTSRTVISFSGITNPEYAVNPLESIMDGITFNYEGIGFGVPPTPTLYKMRAYQTGAGIFEYWISSGAPQLTNPSGLPIAAGSLSVVAMKRPTQLVVH